MTALRRTAALCFAAALLQAGPASMEALAQEGTQTATTARERQKDTWLEFSTGRILFGPFVNERTHAVRFGNMGGDQFFSVGAETRLKGSLTLRGEVMVAPTTLNVWPIELGESPAATDRPTGDVRIEYFTWSCFSVAPGWRPAEWVRISLGGALCQISGARYAYWGAAPRHTLMGAGDIQFSRAVSDRLRMTFGCEGHGGYMNRWRFTVMRVASGERVWDGNPNSPSLERSSWPWTAQCGLGMRLSL